MRKDNDLRLEVGVGEDMVVDRFGGKAPVDFGGTVDDWSRVRRLSLRRLKWAESGEKVASCGKRGGKERA